MISFRIVKRVFPGVSLNLSRSGVSVSLRPRCVLGRRRRKSRGFSLF